jgi:hypothetical protein
MGAPVHGYAGVRRLLHSPLHVYYRAHQDRRVIRDPSLLARLAQSPPPLARPTRSLGMGIV